MEKHISIGLIKLRISINTLKRRFNYIMLQTKTNTATMKKLKVRIDNNYHLSTSHLEFISIQKDKGKGQMDGAFHRSFFFFFALFFWVSCSNFFFNWSLRSSSETDCKKGDRIEGEKRFLKKFHMKPPFKQTSSIYNLYSSYNMKYR